MSVTVTPPAPPPRKKGMGCLGCGCLVLALLLILLLSLVGGVSYVLYSKAQELTSVTPVDIPAPPAGEDTYENAKQKIDAFGHDVKSHQPTTLHLTADEINSLIAHTPAFTEAYFHLFVAMTNDQARIQASLPTDQLGHGTPKGRYINMDITMGITFDSSTKSINFEPKAIKLNNHAVLDETTTTSSSDSSKQQIFSIFNQALNQNIRQDADAANFLDHTKSMEIKNGELVIETE